MTMLSCNWRANVIPSKRNFWRWSGFRNQSKSCAIVKGLAHGYAFVGRIGSWPYRITSSVSHLPLTNTSGVLREHMIFCGCGYCCTHLSRMSTVKYVNCLGKVAGNPEALRTWAPAKTPPPMFFVAPKRDGYGEIIQETKEAPEGEQSKQREENIDFTREIQTMLLFFSLVLWFHRCVAMAWNGQDIGSATRAIPQKQRF